MTNYEKIKAMSVEEMARFFDFIGCECIFPKEPCGERRCEDCLKEFLLQGEEG